MRKFLLIIILSTSCFMGMCQDYIEIDLAGKHIHTRSMTEMPEASIQNDVLSVSFEDSGMYTLYITNKY